MAKDDDPTVPEAPHPRYAFGDPPGEKKYVVDQRGDSGHWIEFGRYLTEEDASAAMAALVAGGSDPDALRVAHRPRYDTD